MNRKSYQKPAMQVVNINMGHLLEVGGSKVSSLNGNVFNGAPKASDGSISARSRDFSDWDDED